MIALEVVSAALAGTPQTQLVDGDKAKKVKGVTPEAMARREQELARLQEAISSTPGHLWLRAPPAHGHQGLRRQAFANARVVRYLPQHRPSFLQEFETIAEATSTLVPEGA